MTRNFLASPAWETCFKVIVLKMFMVIMGACLNEVGAGTGQGRWSPLQAARGGSVWQVLQARYVALVTNCTTPALPFPNNACSSCECNPR